jgi:fucose 4-O-acetylase-like acetyltransferase
MRHGHLDIARAISITLVVMGHGPLDVYYPELNHALGNVRMPLLLMLAGMQLRPADPLWVTAQRKADALLKPYLMMALLLGLYGWLKDGFLDVGEYAAGVLSFNGLQMPGWLFPMWFLTLLWVLHLVVPILLRSAPRHPLRAPGAWMLVASLGLWGYSLLPSSGLDSHRCVSSGLGYTGWMFNLDLLPLGASWFIAGHLMASEWRDAKPSTWHAVVWTVCCAAILIVWQPGLNMHIREADLPLASVAASVSGSWAILGWSRVLQQWSPVRRALLPLGHYSLYILMFHAPVHSVLRKALTRAAPDLPELASWLSVLLVLILCIEVGRQVQKHVHVMALFEPFYRARVRAPRSVKMPAPAEASAAAAAPVQSHARLA